MASQWGGINNAESYDVYMNADKTTGIITNLVPNPTGAVIALDLLVGSARSTGPVNNQVFHIANTVACHLVFGDNTVSAAASDMLLMPGERLMVLPNLYVAVVKAAGSADGIIRFTECV